MKILVTGAHGKVGRALVRALIRAGHDVRATDLTRPQWDRLDDPRLDWRSHLRGPRVLLKGLRDLRSTIATTTKPTAEVALSLDSGPRSACQAASNS